MIRYAMNCVAGHEFEGWFGSSGDYDDQAERGLLQCPVCGVGAVSKSIMAPMVTGTKAQKPQGMMMEALRRIREHVEETFDDVGDNFADEARAIHEGLAEDRGIFGQATPEEVQTLIRDGVPVAPLPPKLPSKDEVN